MKVEVASVNEESEDLKQDFDDFFFQKAEENIAETESQEIYNSKPKQQSIHTLKRSVQISPIHGKISSTTQNSKSQLYSQKEASIRDVDMNPQPEQIYMMQDYLSNFYHPIVSKKLSDKYQSKYKELINSRCSKKKTSLTNFLLLKSLSLSSDEQQNLPDILEFINKYKFKKFNVVKNEKIPNSKQYINCNNHLFQSQPQIIQSEVTFKLFQLQQWTADIINIPDIAGIKLHQQIQMQFFLFMTSNYKILKQASNQEILQNIIQKKSSKQIKENTKEDFQKQIYILSQTTSNFVDEFKKLKQNLEMQSQKSDSNQNQEEDQFPQILQEQIEEGDLDEFEFKHSDSANRKNSFQQKNCNEMLKKKDLQKKLNNNQFRQKSTQLNYIENSISKDKQIKANQLKSQESLQEKIIEKENEQQEYSQEDYEDIMNDQNNNPSSKTNKKKRTNNFYNLPRYFMMLIIELLSAKNLREVGLQDGFVQIISRISLNLRQQGKKNDQAKSNFYNHQHYNCLFQILLDEKNFVLQQSKQTEELFKKVFGVNNTTSQYSQTYINSFKLIISQIVKYQLQIMQDLDLTKYILSNPQIYPFEKSKINYISRVIAGIDKLNSGQHIYRF